MPKKKQNDCTMVFDEQKLVKFKRAFNKCHKGGEFIFEGAHFEKDYAKYVIVYLEDKFKEAQKHKEYTK